MMNDTNNGRRLRLLVAIACYGEKNIDILKRIIARYKLMPMDVEVVVLSEAPKDVGPDVRVVVGLPIKNPWSLPFAHKPVLAEGVDKHDLFIYSEDDMEVSEENIRAFLRITPELPPDEIAGYLRYEVGPDNQWSMPDVHGAYRWKPESVRQRGSHTVAEFTNEHAAFYILTQDQLKRAITSGGFLRGPCEGRHDYACTAATDPYTNCGFKKVVPISSLKEFLIHHASNRYAGQLGLPLKAFEEQVRTLVDIARNEHPARTLCPVEPKLILDGKWPKNFYEKPREELLNLVPREAKTILSIGCGWGATEAALRERGAEVTAVPLDSVIGAVTARQGFKVVYGTLEECLEKLNGRTFDCVLITHLLHLLPDPQGLLERCGKFVRKGGTLVASGPNFNFLPMLMRRIRGKNGYDKLRYFNESGVSVCGPGTLAKGIKNAGMRISTVRWPIPPNGGGGLEMIKKRFGGLSSKEWMLQAQR